MRIIVQAICWEEHLRKYTQRREEKKRSVMGQEISERAMFFLIPDFQVAALDGNKQILVPCYFKKSWRDIAVALRDSRTRKKLILKAATMLPLVQKCLHRVQIRMEALSYCSSTMPASLMPCSPTLMVVDSPSETVTMVWDTAQVKTHSPISSFCLRDSLLMAFQGFLVLRWIQLRCPKLTWWVCTDSTTRRMWTRQSPWKLGLQRSNEVS